MHPPPLPAPDLTIDTSGRLCPYPIVEVARAIQRLAPGGVVCVVATDPGIATDMPMWCRATRNEHLGTFREGRAFRSWVRKRAGAP
jgi:tRNA 2-thiouridine synthesizing protein A